MYVASGADKYTSSNVVPMRALRQFILKIHRHCNLACGYCYQSIGVSGRAASSPPVMSRNIIDITAARIAEHASTHAISAIDVILHGGEPLLAGVDRIQRTVRSIRRAVGNDATVRFAIQTNGIWLDATYL